MFLFKRRGYYHVEYFDEAEQKVKRVSTKAKTKAEALNYIKDFEKSLSKKSKPEKITLKKFIEEYENFISITYSSNYLRSV